MEELEHLHRALTPDERNELLECLLIAASKGPGEMMRALAPWLTAAAAQEMFDEFF